MLLSRSLEVIRALKPSKFDGSIATGFDQIERNNQKQNRKKGSPRTELQVRSDTAKGIGFEFYLECTGLFEVSCEAVEDPDNQLEYTLRQKDFWYGDQSVQVKTISRLHGTYCFIGETMREKIMQSVDLNDFFIFGLGEIHGSRDAGDTVFTYEPGFAIASWALKELVAKLVDNKPIDLCDLHKRPDLFQALHPRLCELEA